MKSYPYSARIARRSRSNFYWSFFFLPRAKKNALFAVYAFSRLVDDAVDEAPGEAQARDEIARWKEWLADAYEGRTEGHPLLPELADAVRRFAIPRGYFEDLLSGMEMDLTKRRYRTFEELEVYCYHVAGTIGLLCNHLFGFPEDEDAKTYAVLLGKAFQMTNILRDVAKDAGLGRIYLPGEELARYRISEADILKGKGPLNGSFLDLMQFEADRAEGFFQKAYAALPEAKRRKILPAEMMAAFYHTILKKMREEGFPVFERKVSLTAPEKLGLVAKALIGTARSWRT